MRFSRLAGASALALVVTAAVAAPAAAQRRPISVCVLDAGMPTMVTVSYDTQTGDTTVADGRRFSEAFPVDAGYAASHGWYVNNEPIAFGEGSYVKYGLPRILGVGEIHPWDEFEGVTLFAEPGSPDLPDVLYVPVRPGCEFQPYQLDVAEGDWEDDDYVAYAPGVTPIRFGETISGKLDWDDAMLMDDSFFDAYTFEGTAGERVRITLRSHDFDAYLAFGYWLDDDFIEELAYDDDSGGDLDSMLEITLPETATYGILANSLDAEETGAYTITLEKL